MPKKSKTKKRYSPRTISHSSTSEKMKSRKAMSHSSSLETTIVDIMEQLLQLFESKKIDDKQISELYEKIIGMVDENHFYIEKFRKKYDKKIGGGEGECAICLEEETKEKPLHKCPACECYIHTECWLKTRNGGNNLKCPNCRRDLIMNDSDLAPRLSSAEVSNTNRSNRHGEIDDNMENAKSYLIMLFSIFMFQGTPNLFYRTVFTSIISYNAFLPLRRQDYNMFMLNILTIILLIFVEIVRDDPDVVEFWNDPNFDRLINSLMARMLPPDHTGGSKMRKKKRTLTRKSLGKI